ncbi:MAG: M67 family metallopeptidase [Thermococcus sp.]|uniref:M67 family metallopeptidase n=1 Tax=Thermococcus sp. TaxID=35749 RepID=UPI001DB59A94|nr:M67 family metallopeptidase [Thermococcus sp.]MBO8174355.1 M67 family metallopeptidase [Thermococcus sp.]
MRLIIKYEHLFIILEKAKDSRIEICGFLLGKQKDGDVIVEEVIFTKNKLNSSTAFEIDPLEIVKVLDYADEKGLEPVGIFHSHLCGPIPSERDIKGMKLWRNVWLIVDNKGNYGAFILEDEKVKKVHVEVIQS